MVGVILLRRDAAVLTMSEEGWAKRTPLSDFPLQKRGGLGTMAIPSGATGGGLVGALEVVGRDEITIVTASGGVTHIDVESVPEQGRRTRGTRITQIPTGDRVVEVARSIASEEGTNGSAAPPIASDETRNEETATSYTGGQSELFGGG